MRVVARVAVTYQLALRFCVEAAKLQQLEKAESLVLGHPVLSKPPAA